MARKIRGNTQLDDALLEMAQDFRGTIFSEETSDKITMRILGARASAAKPLHCNPMKSGNCAKPPT